ncbi:MAG: hypothetical protein ACUVWJ_04725 [Spirochaetota bacterium]
MYVIFVKNDGQHTVTGIAESIDEVKSILKKNDLKDKIDAGKAYLMEGVIKLIRPETTPEILDMEISRKEKNNYY